MVEVVPFHGLLYNEGTAGPLAELVAPPYDVIRPDLQEALYAKNPYNVVRLILGRQNDTDDDNNNRYTRAAVDFTKWQAQDILKKDERPGFYVYSQEYTFNGKTNNRVGFFARVRLEDFSAGNICPHEFTLAKAKQDRTQLIRACKANFSPVFGLYSDPEGALDGKLAEIVQQPPLAVIEEDAILNRLWRVNDSATLDFLSAQFAEKKITIADGHHRYETALSYHQENGSQVPDSAHIMMFLTNLDAQSLAIYPIHRQIKCPTAFQRDEFLKNLEPYFAVVPLEKNLSADALTARLEEAGQKDIAFCVYLGGGDAVLLQLKDVEQIVPFMAPEDSPDLKALDVYQLHALVLNKIMAIDTQLPAHQQYITYNVRTQESMENVDSGKFDLVFFMNATPITQVRELAEKGIRLPQKATYFYPKLLSGLVINRFEP